VAKKNPKFDLKLKYQKALEISLILGLILLISAFKYFPSIKIKGVNKIYHNEFIKAETVYNTKQEAAPPPPPKPPIPIEAPTDIVNDDVIIENSEIDFKANLTPPPPPPVDSGNENFPDKFVPVEEIPQPIGGIQAIQKKIVYPQLAKRAMIEGKVIVKAFVDEKGNVVKAEVIKGIGGGCDEAAINSVLATKFKPGKQRGKPVKAIVVIPIQFKLY